MTFGTARYLSSKVVAIPMASFGMLVNSPHNKFQKISIKPPQGPPIPAGPGNGKPNLP
jgi:hypothetical protein